MSTFVVENKQTVMQKILITLSILFTQLFFAQSNDNVNIIEVQTIELVVKKDLGDRSNLNLALNDEALKFEINF